MATGGIHKTKLAAGHCYPGSCADSPGAVMEPRSPHTTWSAGCREEAAHTQHQPPSSPAPHTAIYTRRPTSWLPLLTLHSARFSQRHGSLTSRVLLLQPIYSSPLLPLPPAANSAPLLQRSHQPHRGRKHTHSTPAKTAGSSSAGLRVQSAAPPGLPHKAAQPPSLPLFQRVCNTRR